MKICQKFSKKKAWTVMSYDTKFYEGMSKRFEEEEEEENRTITETNG